MPSLDDVVNTIKEGASTIDEKFSDAQEKIEKTVDQVQNEVEKTIDDTQRKVEDTVKTVQKTVEEKVDEEIESVKKKVESTIDKGIGYAKDNENEIEARARKEEGKIAQGMKEVKQKVEKAIDVGVKVVAQIKEKEEEGRAKAQEESVGADTDSKSQRTPSLQLNTENMKKKIDSQTHPSTEKLPPSNDPISPPSNDPISPQNIQKELDRMERESKEAVPPSTDPISPQNIQKVLDRMNEEDKKANLKQVHTTPTVPLTPNEQEHFDNAKEAFEKAKKGFDISKEENAKAKQFSSKASLIRIDLEDNSMPNDQRKQKEKEATKFEQQSEAMSLEAKKKITQAKHYVDFAKSELQEIGSKHHSEVHQLKGQLLKFETQMPPPSLQQLPGKSSTPLTNHLNLHQENKRPTVLTAQGMTLNELYTALPKDNVHTVEIQGHKVTNVKDHYNALVITMHNNQPCFVQKAADGINFSISSHLSDFHKKQAITEVCQIAVEKATPGTVFNIEKSVDEAATFKALYKALADKFPGYPTKNAPQIKDFDKYKPKDNDSRAVLKHG